MSALEYCEALPSTGGELTVAWVAVLLILTGMMIRTSRRSIHIVVISALTLSVVMAGGQADASEHPNCSMTLAAEVISALPDSPSDPVDETLAPGEAVRWELNGFAPVEPVLMALVPSQGSSVSVLDSETSDDEGSVALEGDLPSNLEAGEHTLVAIAPVSGIGFRTSITVTDEEASTNGPAATTPATSTTTAPATTSTTTPTTSTNTTTTSVPSSTTETTLPPSTTTTAPSTTTTTIAAGPNGPQSVTWSPRTRLFTTDSPELPSAFPTSTGTGSISYEVVDAGTTGCSINATTGELTYSGTGTCTVEAEAAATSSQGAGTTSVTFNVEEPTCTTKPNYDVGDTGPGGGVIVYEAATCQSWGWFIEAAPASWTGVADSSYRPLWCDTASDVNGARGTRLGSGEANTAAIAMTCTEGAAVDALEHRGSGFMDWYLPSSGEWHQVCRWAHATSASDGGGTTCVNSSWSYANNDGFTDHYWTSTQTSSPVENWMYGGNDFRTVSWDTGYVSARAVRSFGSDEIKAGISTAVRRATSLTIDMTVRFSTAISGLTGDDFFNSGTATGCVFTPAASSGTAIALQAVCSGDGTVIATIAADSVTNGSLTGPRHDIHAAIVPIDSVPPSVSTDSRTVVVGSGLDAEIDERGVIYLVDSSVTPTQESDITSIADSQWNSTSTVDSGVRQVLTSGLSDGTYRMWAIDLAGNVSNGSTNTISVRSPQSCTTDCLLGDIGPGGGTVVYDAGSVQPWGRYIEVAPADWTGSSDSSYRPTWCDTASDIADATGTGIGDGRSNSAAIAAICPEAAAVDAREYRGNGQTDWFLPSPDEWRQVCRWAHANSPSQGDETVCVSTTWSYTNDDGFTDHYWTSAQSTAMNAIENWMYGGQDFRSVGQLTSYVSARPVRLFGAIEGPDAVIVPDVRRTTERVINFTVYVDKAVTGLTGGDFDNAGSATGCTFSTPTMLTTTSYSTTATCTSDGTVIARLAADSMSDGSELGPDTAVTSSVVPVDATPAAVTLTETGTLTFVEGTAIGATLDERGSVYLVDSGVTVTSADDITSSTDVQWNVADVATPTTMVHVSTAGLTSGSYTAYGVDLAGNVTQVGSTTVTVRAAQSCSTTCLVGDTGPGGGVVIYDAGSVQSWGRYLELAPADWSGVADTSYRPIWCDTPASIVGDASGSSIGDGAANTAVIVAGCTSGAAVDAVAYRGGGLSDWFLPSADEQRQVCRFAHGNYRGATTCDGQDWTYRNNVGFTDHYWTSTRVDATNAIETWMMGGNDYRTVGISTSYVSARPIRAF